MRSVLRRLWSARLFTTVATLTLAIGVGTTTAVFSLLDEATLRPLPVRDPGALRTIAVVWRNGVEVSNVPAELFAELRTPHAFAGVLACWQTEMHVSTDTEAEPALVQYVSGNYYDVLGVPMLLGRPIARDQDSQGRAAVVSYRFWRQRFGGDASVIGRRLLLNGLPATVVGVTSPEFFGINRGVSPDVTVPMPVRPPFANLWVVGRLAPGVTDAAATAEAESALRRALETIRPELADYRPADREAILSQRAVLRPGARGIAAAVQPYLQPLRMLLLLCMGLLLVASVNVVYLLLARAEAHEHERSVRLALGAGRARLVAEAVVETVALAVFGCAAGVVFSAVLRRVLIELLIGDLPYRTLSFGVDKHLLAFAAATIALVVVLVAPAAAIRASRTDIDAVLKRAGRRTHRQPLARGLVVAQVALALALLVGAGLLLRSFHALAARDTGVRLDRMLTLRVALDRRTTQRLVPTRTYEQIVDRVRNVPGVEAAALGSDFALGSGRSSKSLWVEGLPTDQQQSAGFNVVGPGFFATAGIPVLLGREFTGADDHRAAKVVIVNEAFVRRYAAGRNAIGLRVGDEGAASIGKYEVVGVVKDSLTTSLRRPPEPMLYQPLLQDEWASSVVLHVRTRGNPRLVLGAVRDAVRAVDPRLPVYAAATLDDRVATALARDRMMAALGGTLGTIALLLTVLGVYGVISYRTSRRTAEIGTRMALGASGPAVAWMIIGEALTLVVLGAAVGVPLAYAAAQALTASLFGVAPQDPLTFAGGVVLLVSTGALAAWLPAHRAARLAPAVALRHE